MQPQFPTSTAEGTGSYNYANPQKTHPPKGTTDVAREENGQGRAPKGESQGPK